MVLGHRVYHGGAGFAWSAGTLRSLMSGEPLTLGDGVTKSAEADYTSPVFITEDGCHWDITLCNRVLIMRTAEGDKVLLGEKTVGHEHEGELYVGIWLRNRTDLDEKSGISTPNIPWYLLSAHTSLGVTAAYQHDVWIPQVYRNEMRGSYYFLSYTALHRAAKSGFLRQSNRQTKTLSNKGRVQTLYGQELLITVNFRARNLAGFILPLAPSDLAPLTHPDDGVTIEWKGQSVEVHRVALLGITTIAKELNGEDAPKLLRLIDHFKAVANKRLTVYLGSSLLTNFARFIYSPRPASLVTCTDEELGDLLYLCTMLKTPMFADIIRMELASRCNDWKRLASMDAHIRRFGLDIWRLAFWSKIMHRAEQTERNENVGDWFCPEAVSFYIEQALQFETHSLVLFIRKRPSLWSFMQMNQEASMEQRISKVLRVVFESQKMIAVLASQIFKDAFAAWAGEVANLPSERLYEHPLAYFDLFSAIAAA